MTADPQDLRYIGMDRDENGRVKQIMRDFTAVGGSAVAGMPVKTNPTTGLLDPTLMPPGIGATEIVLPASEALAAGDVVNTWSDAGVRKARKADASALDKEAHGFVTAGVTANGEAHVILSGECSQAVTPGVGPLYLSGANPGKASATFDPTWVLWQRLGFRAPGDSSFIFRATDPVIYNTPT